MSNSIRTVCHPLSPPPSSRWAIPISRRPKYSFPTKWKVRGETGGAGAAAALVEARPRLLPAVADGNTGAILLPDDRTNDMQAEARALARAANASVYSPQLLAIKYGSRPIKVYMAFPLNFNTLPLSIKYKYKYKFQSGLFRCYGRL